MKKSFALLILIASLSLHAQQPRLVMPKGFFMVSATLNKNGDLATLSRSDRLKVWNLDSSKLRYTLNFKTTNSYNAHFSPDGKYIIVPDTRDKTTIIDATDGKILYTLEGWIQDILKKEISKDGKRIITTPYSAKVAKIWDLTTGKLLQTLEGHTAAVTYSSYNNSGTIIVTGSSDNNVKLWDAQNGKLLHTLTGHTQGIFYVCFSPDDKYLATASYDGTSVIFEVGSGKSVSVLTGHTSLIMDLQFSRNNKYIITASKDKTAALWETATGKKISDLKGHTNDVITCRFTEDEKYVITSSYDGTLKKWSVPNGKIIKTIEFNGAYGTYSIYKNKLILCNDDRISIYTYPELENQYNLLPLDSSNYLVFDTLGRYDGTQAARKLLYFTCGTDTIELNQVKDQLWVPNLAERINSGDSINAKTINDLNICGLTPEIENKNDGVSYYFKITPHRGGLGETILFVNGIEAARYKQEKLIKNGGSYELKVKKEELNNYFINGQENQVTIKAYTSDNTISSRGIKINENKTSKITTPPNLYAVMIGVSDYKGDELDLKYAAKDATDISNAIAVSAKKLLNTDSKEHVFMYNLTTEKEHYQLPEKNSIKKTLEEIGKKATANDILLIFFAGHGVMSARAGTDGQGENKQFYFLTADASKTSAADAVSDVGISTTELTEWMKPQNIKAQKRILIFDACNSGQAIKDFVKMGAGDQNYVAARDDDKAQQIKAIDKLNEKSGLFILSASASNQSAYEMGRYSQGLLTYSLLKAIKQQPDILEDGKYLNISRWFNAAERTVTDLAKESGARQEPQIVTNTNFNIGMVDDEVMAKIILPQEKPLFAASNFQNNDEAADGDDLELSKLINLQLNEIATRGADSRIVYVMGTNSPDAFTLSGRYDIKDNSVTVRISIRQNKEVKQRFELSGIKDKLKELAIAIADKAAGMVK